MRMRPIKVIKVILGMPGLIYHQSGPTNHAML